MSKTQAKEVLEDLLERLGVPNPEDMVKVYLLSFKFPTENLVVDTTIEADERYVYQRGTADKEKYLKLKRLRSRFEYNKRKFMYQSDFGWFSFSEEGVREAQRLLREALEIVEEVRPEKAKEYVVDVIEVYLRPPDAKKLFLNAKKYLDEDLTHIEEKLREYEEKMMKKALSTLKWQYRILREKLDRLIRELNRVGG